jgi:hypothetical protein
VLSHCFQTAAYPRRRGWRSWHWPHHLPHPLTMPRGSAKGRWATHRQRTRSYAKLGWRYLPIPFAAPSKRDSTIRGRWGNSSMSKGSCVRNHSKAIGVTYPFPRYGAPSIPSVASFKGRSRRSKKGK